MVLTHALFAVTGDCSSAISEVLQHIEAGGLLPPLVVLQTLAKNKQLKVGNIRPTAVLRIVCHCSMTPGSQACVKHSKLGFSAAAAHVNPAGKVALHNLLYLMLF